jgi:hypothetical protein
MNDESGRCEPPRVRRTIGLCCAIFSRHVEYLGFLANVLFTRKLNYINSFVF